MAHLWHENNRQQWHPIPLEGSCIHIESLADPGETPPAEVAPDGLDDARSDSGVLLCRCGEPGNQWSLMVPPGASVRVNGHGVTLGLRVLQDRDELVVARPEGEPLHAFFSTEQLAAVVPFPGGDKPVICPRCKQAIKAAMPAIRCPDCGAWHHQIAEGHADHPARECWTYSEHCSLCPQPTVLGAGYRWTPESL